MDSMTLFRGLLGGPVVAATLFVIGLAAVEIWQNIALLRGAERIPARIHACRAADDVTADVDLGGEEKEIPVRAAMHWTLDLLQPVTLLKPKEGLPVVGTFFQLWIRPASCLFFALVWSAASLWLVRQVDNPPPLPAELLFELSSGPGSWKGPAFWATLPLTLLAVAIFGKSILLPARLMMTTVSLGFLVFLIGSVADRKSLKVAAWKGFVQRQSIVYWEKAELSKVRRLVDYTFVSYRYSKTLKEYTRDMSVPNTTKLQLRDAAGSVLLSVDDNLDPPGRRSDLQEWLRKETGLEIDREESQPPSY